MAGVVGRRVLGVGRPGDVRRDRRGGAGAADVEAPLQPLEPGEHGGEVGGGGRQQHAGADQLEQQPRRRRPAHLDQPGVEQVGGAGQAGGAHLRGLAGHPLQLLGRAVQDAAVGHGVEDDEVAQPLEHVAGEAAGVVAALHDVVDGGEDGLAVAGRERLDDVVEQRVRA